MEKYTPKKMPNNPWYRPHLIVFDVSHNRVTARFNEEKVQYSADDGTLMHAHTERVLRNMDDEADQTLDLVDSVTLQSQGKRITVKEAWDVIYSLYLNTAQRRDDRRADAAQQEDTTNE